MAPPPQAPTPPERVLQFGSGMLLRALCAAAVDSANRAGKQAGRIVVVQSTAEGAARALNTQDGLYTLVERGLSGGAPFERVSLIGAISRALAADGQWNVVRDVAALEAKLDTKIERRLAQLETRLTKRMFGFWVAQAATTAALVLGVVKLVG